MRNSISKFKGNYKNIKKFQDLTVTDPIQKKNDEAILSWVRLREAHSQWINKTLKGRTYTR